MKNLLAREQGTVTIEFDERNAVFTLENYRMVCRLIEGRYPNYNSVIPQNNPYKVTVDRQSLIGALRRVSIFSSQASSLIKLRLSNNQITISAQDIDFSASAEETQTCQYDGNDMSIGFKSTFLLDILNNISAEEVVIELADPSRAGVIIPVEQEEKEDLLMLLMPMMLNDYTRTVRGCRTDELTSGKVEETGCFRYGFIGLPTRSFVSLTLNK